MARRDVDDEKRSYSAVFLVAVGFLLAGAIWSVWDDNISRRPWKLHQAVFSQKEQDRIRDQITKEQERLNADPTYVQVTKDLAAANERLATGATSSHIAELQTSLTAVTVRYTEADLYMRIKKSELEEAWYWYETAETEHKPTAPLKAHIDKLEGEKTELQKRLTEAKGEVDKITSELTEIRSEVKTLDDKIKAFEGDKERLQAKLDASMIKVAGFELPTIPKIRQVLLADFERNNFDQSIERVDRCVSCHSGIDKPGFENAEQPYRTHPNRDVILAKHPTDKFGCTPCHQGQGPALNSAEQAHGEVHHFNAPLLRGDKVYASCVKCHANVSRVPGADTIAYGEKLFEELGCHGCHLVEGYDDIAKVAPNLKRIGAKVDPAWLVRWITNPHEFRPKTKMPNFLFKQDEAVAVAAYLLSSTKKDSDDWLATRPMPKGIDANDAALVQKGKDLIDNLGCRGCHGIDPGESPALLGEGKDVVPNLQNIAEKTDARWIYYWIKGPRDYSPNARMPSLRLSDDEAKAITSFLTTLGNKKPMAEVVAQLDDPEMVKRGEKLVRKYGCFGCHEVTGMEAESRVGVELTQFGSKTREELFFGNRTDIPQTWDDWTFNKIKTPRTYATERIEQAMPLFDLPDNDIKMLRIFLASRVEQKYPPKYRSGSKNPIQGQREVTGRRLVNRYNCVGCHIIDGKGGVIRARYKQEELSLAPPILTGEGKKVQTDWLYNFLKQPVPIRPWLKVRMPTFGFSDKEAQGIVEYFSAMDNLDNPYIHIDDAKISAEHIEAGKLLTSGDYFGCFSCHQQGEKKPEGPPEGWAPDLVLARERLKPDWIIDWLHDPQKLMPGTRMPSFYPGGPDDVLGGNEDQQIEALRDYVITMGRPKTTQVAQTQSNDSAH